MVLEIENMLEALKASATAALLREESRGVHIRSDMFFTDNDAWLKEIVLKKDGESYKIKYRPVRTLKETPVPGKYGYMEMVKMLMSLRSDITGGH
mgnify:CR=1 FL=1